MHKTGIHKPVHKRKAFILRADLSAKTSNNFQEIKNGSSSVLKYLLPCFVYSLST